MESREKINHRMEKIKHKLIIISGKGGVGKTIEIPRKWRRDYFLMIKELEGKLDWVKSS